MTAKLILSQIKMLLDRNMLQNKMFQPSYESAPINRIVSDAVHIMRHQAQTKKISLSLQPLPQEMVLKVDSVRI